MHLLIYEFLEKRSLADFPILRKVYISLHRSFGADTALQKAKDHAVKEQQRLVRKARKTDTLFVPNDARTARIRLWLEEVTDEVEDPNMILGEEPSAEEPTQAAEPVNCSCNQPTTTDRLYGQEYAPIAPKRILTSNPWRLGTIFIVNPWERSSSDRRHLQSDDMYDYGVQFVEEVQDLEKGSKAVRERKAVTNHHHHSWNSIFGY